MPVQETPRRINLVAAGKGTGGAGNTETMQGRTGAATRKGGGGALEERGTSEARGVTGTGTGAGAVAVAVVRTGGGTEAERGGGAGNRTGAETGDAIWRTRETVQMRAAAPEQAGSTMPLLSQCSSRRWRSLLLIWVCSCCRPP